jgi:hypothetical protein
MNKPSTDKLLINDDVYTIHSVPDLEKAIFVDGSLPQKDMELAFLDRILCEGSVRLDFHLQAFGFECGDTAVLAEFVRQTVRATPNLFKRIMENEDWSRCLYLKSPYDDYSLNP